jgi:hypothetical protein
VNAYASLTDWRKMVLSPHLIHLPLPRQQTNGDMLMTAQVVPAGDAGDGIRAPVTLYAAVFVKRRATRLGPFRLGHVGWAFQLSSGDRDRPDAAPFSGIWSAGSVDNPGGISVRAPGRHDFWTAIVDDPRPPMRAHGYDACKLLPIATAAPDAALRAQMRVAAGPYVIIFANCMNGVYTVLRAFGAALPSMLSD